MPMYTYNCSNCGQVFEEAQPIIERKTCICPECEQIADLTVGRPASVIPFQLGMFEHIAHNPIYIGSKKELRENCNRYGCIATGID
ncbi:hypothetical protein LCGC14_0914360 [marine sediment metagenome]|uniref:Putative regulatory protein FmdB zinc ribbon domain-containing protein n=1 Tax=marine sediment metagenome TaxID=412755 RepID=A0A0F9RZB9_9ZZZZ